MKRSARSLWHKAMGALVIVLLLQLIIGATIGEAAPPACEPAYHKVRWGETLYSIARRYGVSVWAIAQANGIRNPNCIYACQTLLIPCPCWYPQPCGVQPCYKPCFWLPPPYDPTGSQSRIHIVGPGETLTGIAWRYGTTVSAICRANGILNPNLIHVGQRLVIS